jgi:hypothetical protein
MKNLILDIIMFSSVILLAGFIFSLVLYTIFGKGAAPGPEEFNDAPPISSSTVIKKTASLKMAMKEHIAQI